MRPFVYLELATPEPQATTISPEHSWLLSSPCAFPVLRVFVQYAVAQGETAPSGELFSPLQAHDDGGFDLELGAVLPDLLPRLDGRNEFMLSVPTEDETLTVCFSNHMLRIRYLDEQSESMEAFVNRPVWDQFPKSSILARIPRAATAEALTTVATARFRIRGDTADAALRSSYHECTEKLLFALNRVLMAYQATDPKREPPLSSEYQLNTFPVLILLIRGREPNMFGQGKFVTNLYQLMRLASEFSAEASERLRAHLIQDVQADDIARLLYAARAATQQGNLRHAFLQLVVAAEIGTRRFVHASLIERGTSKGKLENAERDITYSMMLNVLLPALAPEIKKPDRHLLGKMNTARDQRNTLMHTGAFSMSKSELHTLQGDTEAYVEYVTSLLRS